MQNGTEEDGKALVHSRGSPLLVFGEGMTKQKGKNIIEFKNISWE
jgi:hypothetical protein